MKNKWLKKAMAAFLAVLMTVCAVPVAAFVPEMVETGEENIVAEENAVLSAVNINDGSVFVKQATNYTCTLASAVMLVRRRAIVKGNSNWANITESAMRGTAWLEGTGLYNTFTYAGVTVNSTTSFSAGKKQTIINYLQGRPEGIVVYDFSIPHAVLITDYDSATDTFYCADPANGAASGRIPFANATTKGSGQEGKINEIDKIWYVKDTTEYTFTITYNANGGTGAPASQTKIYGQNLTLSSVQPTKDGYTFQGWSTTLNGSVQYNPGSTYTVNDHVTLYAVWNPVKYPIYFNANGGTGAPDTQYQTHFEYLTLSSVVPQRAGYTFQGWSYAVDGAIAYQPGDQFGENRSVTLYAVWTPCIYTISYDANGGENAPAAQTKLHGQNITITTEIPTRAGYTFKGWMGTRESGVVELVPGQVCDYNYSWTFYALWETTFPEQPQVNAESLTAPENIPFTVFWSPVKNADWYEVWLLSETETKNLEWQQTNTFYTTNLPAGNYTFQIAAINQERVNLGIDYANPGFASVTVKPIEDYIPSDKVEWNGHAYWIFDDYLSWGTARQFCEALGGHLATITSEEEQTAIASSSALSTTSQIGFWLGGSDAEEEGSWKWLTGEDFTYSNWHPEGQPDNAMLPHPWIEGLTAPENYLMIYSSKSPDFITTAPQAYWNDSRSNTSSRDIGLICEFEPYTISYDANGGTGAPASQTKVHGDALTLSTVKPTRSGYEFKGWATSSNGNVEYSAGAAYAENADVTLYAVWEVNSVTSITLNKTTATLKKGETLSIAVTVSPSDAANKAFTVTSSNPAVMAAEYRIGVCVGDLFDGSACTATHCEFTALSAGSTTLTFTTEDGQKTASCTVTVTEPVVNAKAKFTLGETSGRPGDTVKITLSLKTEETVNSIAVSGITYDKTVMTFTGFSDYEHIEELTVLPPTFDEEKMAIVIALKTAAAFDGDICTLNFKINENALEGATNIGASSVVKLKSTEIPSAVTSGKVNVRLQKLGDIDGNDTVDIDDAVLLFQYSMLPELYPISYAGNLDFNKDGNVDIDDAVRLFQYSMLPDLYPLE